MIYILGLTTASRLRPAALSTAMMFENRPLGLRFNIFGGDLAGEGIIAHPAGAVEHVAGADGVFIVAVRLGGTDGVDKLAQGERGRSVL